MTLPMQGANGTTATLQAIPSGREGVRATLRIMRDIVKRWRKALPIRELALNLVGDLAGKDFPGEVANIHAWVRDNIRYVKDINGVETIATPDRTLMYGQGDCDDQCVLLASLLESIGHNTRFVAIGTRSPFSFNHVFCETQIGPHWVSVETTEPVEMGWRPENVLATMVQDI